MKISTHFNDDGYSLGGGNSTSSLGGRPLTCLLAPLAALVLLAASVAHAGGIVTAWGYNSYGQTTVPAGLSNVVAVAGGYYHSLALRADGTVAAWGNNNYGQTNVPAGLSNVVAVAGGMSHSLALRADGTVAAWGYNGNGETTVPTGLSNVVAVAGGGYHSLALRADGTVAAWGNNDYGQTTVPTGLNNVVAVAGGIYYSLAVRADGTVAAWGDNSYGQTNVPAGLSNVVAVAGGEYHSLALRTDGTVAAWGNNDYGQTTVPAGLSNVMAVAGGGYRSLALRADGTVAAWGRNNYGETTIPSGLSNVVAVAAGAYHNLALSGSLAPFLNRPILAQTVVLGATATFGMSVTASRPYFYQWQMNGTNLPGATNSSLVLTNVTLSQSGSYSVVVSNSVGTVTSSALLTVLPLIINTQPQSQTVFAGCTASFGVSCQQSPLPVTYQWRKNGTNLPGATNNPLVLTNVTLSQAGSYTVVVSNSLGTVTSSAALLTVVPLAAWGNNDYGQTNVPAGLSNVVAVAGGGSHSLALRADGTVAAWGRNDYGQTTVPVGLSNVVAVAGGYSHSLALRADGTVAAWGYNGYGQTTIPSGLSNVVAVAGGYNHSLALSGSVAPFLNRPLISKTVVLGATATFGLSVTASRPYFYQWQMNGTNLSGATNSSLVLTNVTLSQSGSYSVVVTNSFGSVTSSALLTVMPLIINTQPQSQTVFAGCTASFGVSCQSPLPVTYQWRKNGTNLPGATNNPLVLTNVTLSQAGSYTVVVSNSLSTITSSAALLTVVPLAAWGDNSYGQTTVPAGLSNVVAVAAGGDHSLALRADGTVAAWGNNDYGQTTVPSGLSNVLAVAGGGYHSLALRADGTVAAWGRNDYGQTTVPTGLSNVVAVAGGMYHSLAVRADGSVVAWGYNGYGQTTIPSGLSNVVAVAGGGTHSLAVRADGTVVAWGYNISGQTTIPSGLSNVVAVAGGYYHSLALRADGTVAAWGYNGNGQTTIPSGLSNVVAVAAGGYHNLALSGSLAPFLNRPILAQTVVLGATATFRANVTASQPYFFQWQMNGTNLPGATNSLLVLTNVTFNQTGSYSVVVSNSVGTVASSATLLTVMPLIITTQPQSQPAFFGGSVSFSVECQSFLPLSYQWRLSGTNLPAATVNPLVLTNLALNQAGSYTVVVSNSAGAVISAKVVLTFVPVAAWGNNDGGQTDVPAGLSNVVAVAGGYYHSLALRTDGTVAAWGYNGDGETTVPAGLSNVVAVAGGYYHSLALRADGTVAAWGYNEFGQTDVPLGLSNAVGIAAGAFHSLALRADGTVVAWGAGAFNSGDYPDYGQSQVPLGLDNVVAVAAGGGHSLALRADGTVIAWGDNEYGQTDVPEGVSNVVAVAAGESHSLALRADGTVIAWGDNEYGQMDVPEGVSNVVAVAAGENHSLALGRRGSVAAWGDNGSGQTDVPSFVTVAGGIACGANHSLAVPSVGPPFITSRLANRAQRPGGTVFFRVEANGARRVVYQWRRNGIDLPGKTNAVLQLTGLAPADAGDYSVIVSNALGAATIPAAKLVVALPPLEVALNISLPWELGGDSAWFAQTNVTHDGISAAQSGPITHDQESWLKLSVVGPGTLTFWWKVSSEPDYDFLEFYLDDVLQPGGISGEVPWQKRTYSLSAGAHTFGWLYVKDVFDDAGQDAGWVDEVNFASTMIPFQFAGSLSVSNGVFNMRLTGSPGTSVVVESSFNLTTWTPWQTNTLPADGLDLAMPMGTNQQQFFRARIVP